MQAIFIGWQDMGNGLRCPFFNVNIPGHPLNGSTVSPQTLRENNIPYPKKYLLCEYCDGWFEGSYETFSHMEEDHNIHFPDDYGREPLTKNEIYNIKCDEKFQEGR